RQHSVVGFGECVALARAQRTVLAKERRDDAVGRRVEAHHLVQQIGGEFEQGVRMHRGDYPWLPMANHFRTRPRMLAAAVVGIAGGFVAPYSSLVTRWLIGWNIGVWLYLVLIALSMFRADH